MKKIELSNGGFALVDDEDYPVLSRHKWRKMKNTNTYYVVAPLTSDTKIAMHKMVFGSKPGYVIDHIDRDGLNNQKSNLRFATAAHNAMNSRKYEGSSSKYKGVSWCNTHKKWISYITAYKKRHYVGAFDNEEEAALAWNKMAKKLHGKFSYMNILPDREGK